MAIATQLYSRGAAYARALALYYCCGPLRMAIGVSIGPGAGIARAGSPSSIAIIDTHSRKKLGGFHAHPMHSLEGQDG